MRWIKLEDGTWGLVVLPLHGRGNRDGEGDPVKVLLYQPPVPLNDPAGQWKSSVIANQILHMTHNFQVMPESGRGRKVSILIASREGLAHAYLDPKKKIPMIGWSVTSWAAGLSINGKPVEPTPGFQGAGEVRVGKLPDGSPLTATVEPMHGTDLCIYPHPMRRTLLTNKLVEGHALACGQFIDGSPGDQIVVGWRGTVNDPASSIGLSIWVPLDTKGDKWSETVIDLDGMACEDLQLADLNGDGKLDIVASGRRTHNVKIYFNETAQPKP